MISHASVRDGDLLRLLTGGVGLIGAILCLHRRRWLWLALALAGIAAKVGWRFWAIADSAHLICLLVGMLAQMGLGRPAELADGQ